MTAADRPDPTSAAGQPSEAGQSPEAGQPSEAPAEPLAPLLREPRDGVPDPVVDAAGVADLAERLRVADGPVAIDAERASGYRYSQRAYLVQLRRAGVGTALIDPIAAPDLTLVGNSLEDSEWIVHAAAQDLACLAEIGMRPQRLFDTELAGRLLGQDRVALGTMVERYLGVRLEKGHSAADWSTRPLPRDWLVYAALDVELLIDLRGELATALEEAGKSQWAAEEFEAVRFAAPAPPRVDPWRRTSGLHRVRDRRQLAMVRALWIARDEYAAERDIAPGRVLPDAAIVDAARTNPPRARDLAALPVFGGPRQRRRLDRWFAALTAARRLPDSELPPVMAGSGDGMPAPTRWRDRDPEAAARLQVVRQAVTAVAQSHEVLAQNLLASDVVRRLCWSPPPAPTGLGSVAQRLTELGARPWQVALCAGPLTEALQAAAG